VDGALPPKRAPEQAGPEPPDFGFPSDAAVAPTASHASGGGCRLEIMHDSPQAAVFRSRCVLGRGWIPAGNRGPDPPAARWMARGTPRIHSTGSSPRCWRRYLRSVKRRSASRVVRGTTPESGELDTDVPEVIRGSALDTMLSEAEPLTQPGQARLSGHSNAAFRQRNSSGDGGVLQPMRANRLGGAHADAIAVSG